MWERMTGKFETKEEILKWKYRGKIGAKSENNFKKGKKKNTDEAETIWESDEEVEEEKDFMEAIKIKITAEENFFSSFLKLPGCVPIDIRVCLKKHFLKAEVEKEGSLKFFLKKGGLDAKADMPYDEMWRIYSETKRDPSQTTELLVKLSVINDYREVASIAYVSLFDSHYRANGMKIRNLLGTYAFKRNMVFSTRVCENIEKGKYPGAYVFPPKKGIESRRPVTGLDFALLYPSLIMAYNLSPDKIILTHGEADIVEKNGNILHKIEFPFNNRTVQA
ncbi:hypothetical protein RhiirC2_720530 [Rhizophagus irregularis]|uniref:DNA-directed DNA polymerase n=1 Tax=Rhizophagus irregularis TaxID=588596 RepID=A0A2N1M9V4_9GLOM|nr:hypothetical protein RhiirC2_720530 [Rhizophagus irregularis]